MGRVAAQASGCTGAQTKRNTVKGMGHWRVERSEGNAVACLTDWGAQRREYRAWDFFQIRRLKRGAQVEIEVANPIGNAVPVLEEGRFFAAYAGSYTLTLTVRGRKIHSIFYAALFVTPAGALCVDAEDLSAIPREAAAGQALRLPLVLGWRDGGKDTPVPVSVTDGEGRSLPVAQSGDGYVVTPERAGEITVVYHGANLNAARQIKVYPRASLARRAGVRRSLGRVRKFDVVANWQYYAMLLPAVVLFFFFTYMSLPGILLAFQRYTITGGLFHNEWIGLENFQAFFAGPYFWRTTRNTFIINIFNLIFGTASSILFALLINELISPRMKKLYQNILFLPTFFSVLLVSRFISLIFSNDRGILNSLIEALGFSPIAFYDSPQYWVPIVIGAYIWKGVGYNLIVYLATIMGVDRSIYEAAHIDGAGRMKQVFYVTIPLLTPTIIILVMLNIGRIFYGDFQMIYAIVGTSNTALMESLDIIETYLFRMVTGATPDYGVAAAVGMYQTVLGFLLIFGSNTLIKLYNKDYALF